MWQSSGYNKTKIYSLLSLVFILAIRVPLLYQSGLYDYDSVSHYEVSVQVSKGHFHGLFLHAAPFMHLLQALIWLIFPHYRTLEVLSMLTMVAGLGIYAHILSKSFLKDGSIVFSILFVLLGTSPYLVNASRYVSIEPFTILFSALLLYALGKELRTIKSVFIVGLLAGLLLCFNYKALIWLPCLLVFYPQIRINWRFALYGFSIPFFLMVLLGTVCCQSPLQYFKVLTYIAFIKKDKFVDPGLFNKDVFFYIKYLFIYENLLLIPAFVLFPFTQKNSSEKRIWWSVCLFICIMSVLQKAPRGIIFVYPFLYYFLFTVITHYSEKNWVLVLLRLTNQIKNTTSKSIIIVATGIVVCLNLYMVYIHIYRYLGQSYEDLAVYIKNHVPADTVYAAVNPALKPLLYGTGKSVKVIFDDKDIAKGKQYLILDDYYRINQFHPFKKLEKEQPLVCFTETSLQAPILSFEHADFSGIGFDQTELNRTLMLKSPCNLRLILIDR